MPEDVWTIEDHLDGKPAEVAALYRRFVAIAEACGPFSYRVTKTAITLKGTRRGFAGVRPKERTLDGYLDLQREVRDPRIRRVEPYTKRLFVHHFRVVTIGELDEAFGRLICEAYEVGAGAHVRR